ncbi:hypothetical protein PMAYCL1PPCAC_10058, partial [Pristionchus mayeri]
TPQMSSSSRGRGRGRGGGGGGGWGREEWRHSAAARVSSSDWASQQAGSSMQQLQLQPRPVQLQPAPVVLTTSRGPQHVRPQQQPQQQQQQQKQGGRQQNRQQRSWNEGGSQHQQQQQHKNQSQLQQQRAGQQQQHQLQQQLQQAHQRPAPQGGAKQQNQRPVQQAQQQRGNETEQHGKRRKRRRQTSGFYQGRAAEQLEAATAAASAAAAADSSDDLPGFTRCPETGKYFRITADSSGLVGHRVSDVRAAERKKREEEEAKREKEREEEMRKKTSTGRRPASVFSMLSSLSLGRLAGPSLPRAAASARMQQQLPGAPTQIIDASDFLPLSRYAGMHSVVGCEFLDVSAEGETLTGCWAIAGSSAGRTASLACSVRASVAERGGGGRREREQPWLSLPALRGAPLQVRANAIVDMAMAPTDRDVTCLLYTTATSTLDKWGRPITQCEVSTRPVYCRFEESEDGYDVSDASIYNVQTRLGGNVYSCAWSQKMKIGLGMERHATLLDVMTDEKMRVNTRKKVPISQAFDESGDTLYLGLRYVNACIMDMRASMEEAAAVIPDSRSTGWLRLLHKAGPQVVLSTLEGKLCLYDIRRPCVPLLSYSGHRAAGGARLPSFVDDDEQFVFAVGADFATRVWSLSSGALLHELQLPAAPAAAPPLSDYPRPVYSTRWAGKHGAGALVVAAGAHLNVYRIGHEMEEE